MKSMKCRKCGDRFTVANNADCLLCRTCEAERAAINKMQRFTGELMARCITVDLPETRTNPDDWQGEQVAYVGVRQPPHYAAEQREQESEGR